jgi:hypothetical protein
LWTYYPILMGGTSLNSCFHLPWYGVSFEFFGQRAFRSLSRLSLLVGGNAPYRPASATGYPDRGAVANPMVAPDMIASRHRYPTAKRKLNNGSCSVFYAFVSKSVLLLIEYNVITKENVLEIRGIVK